MCAFCAEGLDLASSVDEQDLAALNALDLDLLFGAGRQGQRGEVFEFIFLGHDSRGSREMGFLNAVADTMGSKKKRDAGCGAEHVRWNETTVM